MLRSGYVPAAVGGGGVLAAGLLFAATLASIVTALLPALASVSEAVVQGAAMLAMLFQLAAGAWLIAKSGTHARPQPECATR